MIRMHPSGVEERAKTPVKPRIHCGPRAIPKVAIEGERRPQGSVLPAAWPGVYLFLYLPLGERDLETNTIQNK